MLKRRRRVQWRLAMTMRRAIIDRLSYMYSPVDVSWGLIFVANASARFYFQSVYEEDGLRKQGQILAPGNNPISNKKQVAPKGSKPQLFYISKISHRGRGNSIKYNVQIK